MRWALVIGCRLPPFRMLLPQAGQHAALAGPPGIVPGPLPRRNLGPEERDAGTVAGAAEPALIPLQGDAHRRGRGRIVAGLDERPDRFPVVFAHLVPDLADRLPVGPVVHEAGRVAAEAPDPQGAVPAAGGALAGEDAVVALDGADLGIDGGMAGVDELACFRPDRRVVEGVEDAVR